MTESHLERLAALATPNSIEAYIQFERGLITEDGRVTNESIEEFLRKYMAEFQGFIARVCTVLPRNA